MQATTKDNGSLKATVSRLSSQITNLEASLAAKNKELDRREKEQKDESQRIEEVWRGVLDEKSRNWEGKEKTLSEKLEHQETVLKEIKASYEVAQRMGPTSPGAEDDLLGKERAAELEIVTRDLERTTLRLTEVEGRNEQLRLELERASTGQVAPTKTQAESEEDDTTILRLQHENADLLRKVRNAKSDLDAATKDSERKIRSLERLIAGVENDKEALKEKVSSWSDYADVKRELEILKSIEFSTGDDDDDDDDSEIDTHLDLLATSKKESLEQLLLARNKKLGNELTVLRVSHQDLSQRLSTLQHSLDTATADLAASKSLNARLEDDLLKLQQQQYQPSQYTPGPAPSIAGTYASRYPSARPRISPTSSIIGGSSPGTLDSLRTLNDASPNAGILPMITAQRDRFKQRNAALEESLSTAHTTISTLRDEVASLQKDNLALYEKTRYVSSYTPSTTTMTSGFAPPATSIDRYRQAYEANISPFEAFRGRESARAYHRLGVPERLIYSLTRVILANRVSRNVFAAYCVALHGLVLCMLYWAGTGTGGVGKWEQVGFDERL